MNAILLKVIIALYAFIASNGSIPQDVKDQALQVISDNASTIQAQQQTECNPVVQNTPVVTTSVQTNNTSTAVQSGNQTTNNQVVGSVPQNNPEADLLSMTSGSDVQGNNLSGFTIGLVAKNGDILLGTESSDIPMITPSNVTVTQNGTVVSVTPVIQVMLSNAQGVIKSGLPSGYFKLAQNNGATIPVKITLPATDNTGNVLSGHYTIVLNQIHYVSNQDKIIGVNSGKSQSAAPTDSSVSVTGSSSIENSITE